MSRSERVKKLINDIILIIAILIVGTLFLIFKQKGDKVVITVDNVALGEYSLSENNKIQLEFSTIVIENGAVYVENTTCPDKICKTTGKISDKGEVIVCVPNKMIVEIKGSSADVMI